MSMENESRRLYLGPQTRSAARRGPLGLFRNTTGYINKSAPALLADAKATEDRTEKIVSAYLTRNASQRHVRQAQFFGAEFPLPTLVRCLQMEHRCFPST